MSALVEHGRYLLDRHGKPRRPLTLAVVDYLTSTRAEFWLASARLVEDDIAGALITNADRLDPKEEMQVSVELILDGAAARIAAAT